MMSSIGIFDSGVGGLGIFRSIRKLLPQENIIYFADTVNFPYGDKTGPEIQQIVQKIVDFLIKKDCKLIIVGCNTASVTALNYLRSKFRIPLVGVVPVIKTISHATLNKRVGILATKLTINSGYLKALVEEFCPASFGYKIFYQDAQELVDLVENGDPEQAEQILVKYIGVFKKNRVDAIALGSTHLPFFEKQIQHFLGPSVYIFDSNNAVARQVKRVLTNNHQLGKNKEPKHQFFTSGDAEEFAQKIENLIHYRNPQVEKISLR